LQVALFLFTLLETVENLQIGCIHRSLADQTALAKRADIGGMSIELKHTWGDRQRSYSEKQRER